MDKPMKKAESSLPVLLVCLFVILFSVVFSFTSNGFTLGDEILNALNLPAWSDGSLGTHYTIFYSLGMMTVSVIGLFEFCHLSAFLKRHQYLTTISLVFIAALLLLAMANFMK